MFLALLRRAILTRFLGIANLSSNVLRSNQCERVTSHSINSCQFEYTIRQQTEIEGISLKPNGFLVDSLKMSMVFTHKLKLACHGSCHSCQWHGMAVVSILYKTWLELSKLMHDAFLLLFHSFSYGGVFVFVGTMSGTSFLYYISLR